MIKIDITQNLPALPRSPRFLAMYKRLLGRKLTPEELKLVRSLKAQLRKELDAGGS